MMVPLVLAAVVAPAAPGQTLAGPAFERFASLTDRSCRANKLRDITPGDLSWQQETFEDRLSLAGKRRLADAGRRERHCMAPGGLACPTTRTLDAMWRTGLLTAFGRFACTHTAPAAVVRSDVSAAAGAAAAVLDRLDLNSFPNSTGPRRRPFLHMPADYGFTKLEGFDDGWAQISEPGDRWHMSALILSRQRRSMTICFLDTGGQGATYRATEVLHVVPGKHALWTADRIASRADCRNVPPVEASGVVDPADPGTDKRTSGG